MKRIIPIALLMIMAGCRGDYNEPYERQMCIEGWIENDANPIVLLSETLQPCKDYKPLAEAFSHPLHNAEIIVSAKGQSYILEERYDENYNPPYIYTCDELYGEENTVYTLDVTCEEMRASSLTRIGNVIKADSIVLIPNESLNQFSLNLYVTDHNNVNDWYKVFVSTDSKQHIYLSSFLGTVSTRQFNGGQICIPIYRGRIENGEYYTPFFNREENISVKLCHIDSLVFEFWSEYDKMLVLSRNPFLTYQANLPSNIKGGLGYWFGYASKTYHINSANK